MEYKVLIRIYVPEIEENYEIYIPINKTVYQTITTFNNQTQIHQIIINN